jgi:hypothetical protein
MPRHELAANYRWTKLSGQPRKYRRPYKSHKKGRSDFEITVIYSVMNRKGPIHDGPKFRQSSRFLPMSLDLFSQFKHSAD